MSLPLSASLHTGVNMARQPDDFNYLWSLKFLYIFLLQLCDLYTVYF